MNTSIPRPRSTSALLLALVLGLGAAIQASPSHAARPPPAAPVDMWKDIADDVTAQMLASDNFKAKISAGRKLRVVVGSIDNSSDDESVRVEDIFNEIRDRLVATGAVRLFDPGELNADLIISPVLTSRFVNDARGRRQHCFVLELTLTTISGEYITAYNAKRCDY